MISSIATADNDSLHVLPLAMIPLQVKALQKTRLIKNTRMQGVIELYSEGEIGSGQVNPDELEKVFDFSGDRARDLVVVKKLATLFSYDVYSLRVSLRKLNIEVDNIESLRLSNEMTQDLADHMYVFTHPLILKIYGDANVETGSFRDVLKLFTDPNADDARKNLRNLANSLEIKLMDIPKFLEAYADVFLSLSFYQKCHDDTAEDLATFIEDLQQLANSPQLVNQGAAANDIAQIASEIDKLHRGVANTIELFRLRTEDMWENISAERYRGMTQLITDHQEKIGAILCAITVKLNAWQDKTSVASTDSISDRIGFVTREIGFGLDRLTGLEFQDI